MIEEANNDTIESADLIDKGITSDAYQRSECIVVFHLIHAIRMGHPIGKEIWFANHQTVDVEMKAARRGNYKSIQQ